jgi:hypoxanthine phosphoribosyltransferase
MDERLVVEHDGMPVEASVVISGQAIVAGVRRVAEQVAAWAGNADAGPLQLVSILHGAKPFTRDLRRDLDACGLPNELHEIKVSSTQCDRVTGKVDFEFGSLPPESIRGARVLIVDDIIDTSATVTYIKKMVEEMRPAEVRVAVVVNKYAHHSHRADFKVHDLAFGAAPSLSKEGSPVDYWLFGYGMDLCGKYRELSSIGWVEVSL